ncbi:MAG: serine hydrolase [Desulfotomaculum sp.]|nr:serine hydrolase [Desulfotomaculum sp.]
MLVVNAAAAVPAVAASHKKPLLVNWEQAVEYHELRQQLEALLKNEKGTYGIFVIDLKTNKSFGINRLEPFHAASTFKLPLNVYLYKKIAEGLVDSQKRLVYQEQHYETGTGSLQYKPVGSTFNVGLLSKYSIVYSDNVAANMLVSYLGMKNIKNYMRAAGGVVVKDDENITSPQDMALYMYEFLEFNKEQPETAQVLMEYLKNTVFNNRIPKLLPDNVPVAHKTGDWPLTGTYNDVGYVQHPDNPYIIAILSKNTAGRDGAFEVIRQISRIVYDYQSRFVAVNLLLNGYPLEASAAPVLKQGVVWVPVREVAEALLAEVHWNDLTGTIYVTKPGTRIEFNIGNDFAIVNDVVMPLGKTVKVINGKTMVPVRFICETLGAGVVWNGADSTVNITGVLRDEQ